MKKRPRKPSGVVGMNRFGGHQPEFLQIPFPENKDDLETFIASQALPRIMQSLRTHARSINKNETDDFDFTLDTGIGQVYLELMEIAPLDDVNGGYKNASPKYNVYEFARYIVSKIVGKSAKYGKSQAQQVCLLLYVTDWKFILHEDATRLLQYWMLKRQHFFASIFLYQPISLNEGFVSQVFRVNPKQFVGFNPSSYKEKEVINLDPNNWRPSNPGLKSQGDVFAFGASISSSPTKDAK